MEKNSNKLTIEMETGDWKDAPTITTIKLNGEPLGRIQNVLLTVSTKEPTPRLDVGLPRVFQVDVNETPEGIAAARALNAVTKDIADKLQAAFPWLHISYRTLGNDG